MKTGPKCDTLFSQFWNERAANMSESEFAGLTRYSLMRWAFREGFHMRGERDRKARRESEEVTE
jgi:hypothetical protein